MCLSTRSSTEGSPHSVVVTGLPLTAAPLATGVRARANLGGNGSSRGGKEEGFTGAEDEGDGCHIANHQTKQ